MYSISFKKTDYIKLKTILFKMSGFYLPKHLNWKLSNFLKFLLTFCVLFSHTHPYMQKMWNDHGSLQRPAASYDIWQCHTDCMTLPDVIWRCHISIWRCRMSKWHCKATFWRQPGYLNARLSARMHSPEYIDPSIHFV